MLDVGGISDDPARMKLEAPMPRSLAAEMDASRSQRVGGNHDGDSLWKVI
jgi:hypothetical protein